MYLKVPTCRVTWMLSQFTKKMVSSTDLPKLPKKIVEAGKREFLAKGFKSASLRAIVREAGFTQGAFFSVSAPVRSPGDKVIAAVSVSGPIERLTRQPGRLHAPAVVAAAERLSEVLRRSGAED